MFFHGIPLVHLVKQAPVLSPSEKQWRQSPSRQRDARQLEELLGFEPVHLLRSSANYPRYRCIQECLQYGDTVWVFHDVGYPRVQLSEHEWGVQKLDMRQACGVFTVRADAPPWIRAFCPEVLVSLQRGREWNRSAGLRKKRVTR
ncbi:hypothetical protein [Desmospora activa]|uniref:Uncharacterized protein n=1 Tax=Desmospora activa DSM 45169 TaxID=1121389 RepID=A0A2T4Z8H8_9BACL|nr:hypothetical protein [Desmospora activa]PTM58199.1 hypothetical protein C8J48_0777 [Desmospora activa DSM 45169]